jgi:hypothetical protein
MGSTTNHELSGETAGTRAVRIRERARLAAVPASVGGAGTWQDDSGTAQARTDPHFSKHNSKF